MESLHFISNFAFRPNILLFKKIILFKISSNSLYFNVLYVKKSVLIQND